MIYNFRYWKIEISLLQRATVGQSIFFALRVDLRPRISSLFFIPLFLFFLRAGVLAWVVFLGFDSLFIYTVFTISKLFLCFSPIEWVIDGVLVGNPWETELKSFYFNISNCSSPRECVWYFEAQHCSLWMIYASFLKLYLRCFRCREIFNLACYSIISEISAPNISH